MEPKFADDPKKLWQKIGQTIQNENHDRWLATMNKTD